MSETQHQACVSGWINKRSANATFARWQRRYFRIQDSVFAYYRSPESLFPQYFISLHDIIHVHLIEPESARFDIITRVRVLHLDVRSTNEAKLWITNISSACRSCRQLIKEGSNRVTAEQPTRLLLPTRTPNAYSLTPLKVAFLQLHYSLSSLNQRDFFRDIVNDFQNDQDVLAFILDLIIHPNMNSNSAYAIRQSRWIEDEQFDTRKQSSRTPPSSGIQSTDSAHVEHGQLNREQSRPRSNSDCSLEVLEQVTSYKSACYHSDDMQCKVKKPSGVVKRYALFYESAMRMNFRSVLEPRARTLAWLHGDEVIHFLVIVSVSHQPRLALSALFALLLVRNHDDDVSCAAIVTANTSCVSQTSNTKLLPNGPSTGLIFYSNLLGSSGRDDSEQFMSPMNNSTKRHQMRTSPVSKQNSHSSDSTSSRSIDGSPPHKRSADQFGAHHWMHRSVHSCQGCHTASGEFVKLIKTFFSKSSISHAHIRVLLSMLCVPAVDFGSIRVDEKHNVFNKQVVYSYVWPALFTMIHLANDSVKLEALKSISGLMIGTNGSEQNCDSLIQFDSWQTWLMSFFDSKNPTIGRNEVPNVSYQTYAHNILSLLHFHQLLHCKSTEFNHSFRRSLALSQSQTHTEHVMLLAMIRRLTTKLRNKSVELAGRWPSILSLIALASEHVTVGFRPHEINRVNKLEHSIDDDRDLTDQCISLLVTAKVIARSYDDSTILNNITGSKPVTGDSVKRPCNTLYQDGTLLSFTTSNPMPMYQDSNVSSNQDQVAFLLCQDFAAVLTDLNAMLSILSTGAVGSHNRLSLLTESKLNDLFAMFRSQAKREKVFSMIKLNTKTE